MERLASWQTNCCLLAACHDPLHAFSSAPLIFKHLQGLGDADLTFQPQLNQRSLKLAAEREARELFEASTGAGQRPRSAGGMQTLLVLPSQARAQVVCLACSAFELCRPGHMRNRCFWCQMPHAGARRAAGGDPEELCTFSPAINPASERLLEDSATVPSGEWTGAMGSACRLAAKCLQGEVAWEATGHWFM